MKENKNRIQTIKKILNHKQSKEIYKRNTFDKQNSIQFDKNELYKRVKTENVKRDQDFTNLIVF